MISHSLFISGHKLIYIVVISILFFERVFIMFTSRKLSHILVTSFGNLKVKNNIIKDKSVLEFMSDCADKYGYWLYCLRGRKYKSSEKAGKWMLFVKDNDLEKCWDSLAKGIDKGIFDIMKCSVPNRYNPNYTPGISAIMVYTNDYEDVEDIKSVLKYLIDNGLDYGEELFYKADYQTRAGKYEGGRGESWLYSSKDFE